MLKGSPSVAMKTLSLRELAQKRDQMQEEIRILQTDQRILNERVAEKLMKDGRWDLVTVNWNKLKRIG